MRKQRFKTIKLFLKLQIFFQIHRHHTFTAGATPNPLPNTCNERNGSAFYNPISENETDDSVLHRSKRPARLLPLRTLL